jgi:hypothetical protein
MLASADADSSVNVLPVIARAARLGDDVAACDG